MSHLLKVCNYEKVCTQAEHADKSSNPRLLLGSRSGILQSQIPAEAESFG